MPTFYVEPSSIRGEITAGVIAEIIGHHERLLPEFGWTEVDQWAEADLCIGHLGARTPQLDVFHCHGLYPTGTMKLPRGCWEANATIIENMRRSREIIAVSEWVADIIRRDLRRPCHVVGHGIDLEAWAKVPHSQLPFAKGQYVLWNKTRTLGVCDPRPVLDLAHKLPDVHFVTTFLPDGEKVPPNVTVTGLLPKEEMWTIVKSASAYLATTPETFGVGILEAMASGVPVVSYDKGAVPSVLAGSGIVVDWNDIDALAEGVMEALQGDSRDELIQQALQRVQDFDWRRVVEDLAKLYEMLLPRPQLSPKVTVVIPCFNYSRYVGQAIQSVLEQTLDDIELIVIDDGSSDNSVEVIKEAIEGDPRARLIEQENTGVAEARNHAIREGTGEYICALDADDMMHPRMLERCVEVLEHEPSLAIAYTKLVLINQDDEIIKADLEWPWPYDRTRGLEYNQVPTCCVYRREWWERTGGYKTRFLSQRGAGQEDGDLWFNILAHGGGAAQVTGDPLFLYRIHPLQATRNFRAYWERTIYHEWYPWVADNERHPIASQLLVPKQASLPVYDYDRPRIAVVVPVGPYHQLAFVDALDSVISQTYRQWELIIVNDTGDEIDTSAWPFATVLRTEHGSMGPGHARNMGTAAARAPLVVYLDADDIMQPRFLEETLKIWLEVGGWVYTDFYYIAQNGNHRLYKAPDWSLKRLWNKGLAAITALYPVEAWRAIGGFDEEVQHEDWEFHIKLAMGGWCGTRIALPLMTYRHETGLRREEGIEAKGFIDIKKRYTQEALMGCGCGRGGGRSTRTPTVAAAARPARSAKPEITGEQIDAAQATKGDDSWIPLYYIGRSNEDLIFKGRNGRDYIFSKRRPVRFVHPMDIGRLERNSVLKRLSDIDLQGLGEPDLVVPRTVLA